MAAIIGPEGPSMATKIAVDGPRGDHLRQGTNCGMTDLTSYTSHRICGTGVVW